MSFLLKYLRKHTWLIILTLLLAAIGQIFSMMDPYIMRLLIDGYTKDLDKFSSDDFIRGVLTLGLAIIGVAMVSRIAKAFQDYMVNLITQKVSTEIYNDGLQHALSLPYEDFEDQRSGETLGILQKVKTDVQRLLSTTINILFVSLVGIVAVTIYSFSVYWAVGPLFIITIPVLIVLSGYLTKKIKKIQKRIVSETTALAGSTTESLRNIELVKSTGLVDQEINRLNDTTNRILDLEIQKVKYVRSLSFIQGTVINFLRTSIIVIMAWLIFLGKISVGEFFSLFMYSFFIFGPLQEIGNLINIYSETLVSLQNFKQLMARKPEMAPEQPVHIDSIDNITFNNVCFTHQSANKPALSNISFDVRKGEKIAFVGPSGAGKSTLIKLLVGLYKPKKGRVAYSDIPIESIDINDIRHQIGIVNQETHLFAGTIRDNLLFVKPDASDEELEKVLRMAAADSLLDRADKGIYTTIGEGGIKISGGEKQRISIARALLRNPNLLVFDEATSALDSLTEEEINETIEHLPGNEGRITFLIAHRLSTIMHCDRIYVLESGRIVESGKHTELLDQKGLYYAMWRQQVGLEPEPEEVF
ncbi:MAG TPA: ABC transporter ATP-binding protein [Saprospiraceae bacterium]|nr:MAG: ABC transporter ATP-binding protein [Saprospiraceae bacterium]HRN32729.1 ABC transporter ATP-binding protein [Saprospiraceae bacterium]HRP83886.1 ABC transporter ATP-binding protein [Saprospiraceae bacterium]